MHFREAWDWVDAHRLSPTDFYEALAAVPFPATVGPGELEDLRDWTLTLLGRLYNPGNRIPGNEWKYEFQSPTILTAVMLCDFVHRMDAGQRAAGVGGESQTIATYPLRQDVAERWRTTPGGAAGMVAVCGGLSWGYYSLLRAFGWEHLIRTGAWAGTTTGPDQGGDPVDLNLTHASVCVWLPEYQKRAVLDPTVNGAFVDASGTPLDWYEIIRDPIGAEFVAGRYCGRRQSAPGVMRDSFAQLGIAQFFGGPLHRWQVPDDSDPIEGLDANLIGANLTSWTTHAPAGERTWTVSGGQAQDDSPTPRTIGSGDLLSIKRAAFGHARMPRPADGIEDYRYPVSWGGERNPFA